MYATNPDLSKATERAGKQWTWEVGEGIHNEYSSRSQLKKYNSTIVNLGMYISLGNRENCNKCISAFVYTF